MLSLKESISWPDTGLLPGLVADYIQGKESLAFLAKYPFEIEAFKQVIADKQKDNTDRKLLVEVLQAQYANIETSSTVTANIQSLLSDNTFTVTAAHQPCLFMGPLYNIYKISCAINLAKQLKQHYPDYNFVPVFWLGSEDHDTEELNHTFVNGKKILWQGASTGASGRWSTASMQTALDELKTVSANTDIIDILEQGIKKYETFGRFSQYFVNEIFKEHGLVVLDQDDAKLKGRFAPYIKEEVLHSRAVGVLKDNIEFLEANYKAQARPREINFFYLVDGYRERIVLDAVSGRYTVNNTDVVFSRDEIVKEIDAHPERFSPNVIYRPLYQEVILPNLAFVGGAGELSYWLELKPLFDHYKINYPMQVMRGSAAIITPPVQKKLEKLNLSVTDFFADIEQLINSYIKRSMDAGANLSAERLAAEELFTTVLAKAEAVDVTLKQSASGERQKLITALENLEAKMVKAEKRKQETTVTQIRSIHDALFPDGTLQERHDNFIGHLDSDFIAVIVEQMNAFDKQFKVLVRE